MKRYQQLDFFRGILLVIITVDHFLVYNNVIKRFTSEFLGWVSAAEGFVFISGLTAGLVYTYKFNQKGKEYITGAARKRTGIIYRNHMVLFLLTFLGVMFIPLIREYWLGPAGSDGTYALFLQRPFWALAAGAVLLYQPMLLDILPMYAVFMLLVPAAITAFHKGLGQKLLVISGLLYAVTMLSHAFGLTAQLTGSSGADLFTGAFNIFCWQLLFFAGLFTGFSIYHGKTKSWQKNNLTLVIAVLVGVIFFAMKNFHLEAASVDMDKLTDKSTLGIIRLVDFAALVVIGFFIAAKGGKYLEFKPVCYLGRYSLEVFSLQIILVIFLKPVKDYFNSIHAIQITERFYFYPLGTLLLFLLVLPALFLAPRLLGKKLPAQPAAVGAGPKVRAGV